MGLMAVPADGSCCMPCAGILFPMSHTMGEFPSQKAAFEFCLPDMLLSKACGYRGKTNAEKLMLSLFSEIDFFLIYTKLYWCIIYWNTCKFTPVTSHLSSRENIACPQQPGCWLLGDTMMYCNYASSLVSMCAHPVSAGPSNPPSCR